MNYGIYYLIITINLILDIQLDINSYSHIKCVSNGGEFLKENNNILLKGARS